MRYLLLTVIAALLAGCGTFGMNTMSAEQITASAKAKDANVVCVHASGLWGKATTTFVNVDKGVVIGGGIAVDAECQVQFATQGQRP